MLPKRLSTHRRPLHASPTLRSETVTRMAHQAAANPTQSFAIPALHLEAASVVRTGRRSRNKVGAGWVRLDVHGRVPYICSLLSLDWRLSGCIASLHRLASLGSD